MVTHKWYTAYRILAEQFEFFYYQNHSNSGIELYKLCIKRQKDKKFASFLHFISNISNKMLDPIMIFAYINNVNNSNKLKIDRFNFFLEMMCSHSGMDYEFVQINDFNGCPAPKTSHIIVERSESDIQNIWQLLANVIDQGRIGLNESMFTSIDVWKGLGIPAVTIFLFWIDSNNFIALDNNMVSFLRAKKIINSRHFTFQLYSKLLQDTAEMDYVSLSIDAYNFKNSLPIIRQIEKPLYVGIPVGKPRIPLKPVALDIEKFKTQKEENAHTRPFIKGGRSDFKIIGLKVYDKTVDSWKRVLETDRLYKFSNAYEFIDKDNINYDPTKDLRLYNLNELSVSISAIVGKNGLGKSSLIDLIYVLINNLSKKHPSIKDKMIYVPDVYLDFYYATEDLYGIELRNKTIKIKRYEINGNNYKFTDTVDIKNFQLEDLFYTVSLNYAHFSLNSRHLGDWIDYLFHKNDSYQQPLVLNPHRNEGNVDINEEEDHANARLLSNVLFFDPDPSASEKIKMFREITDKQSAEKISLKYNNEKMESLYVISSPTEKDPNNKIVGKWEVASNIWPTFITAINKIFDIPEGPVCKSISNEKRWIDVAYKYILKKIISISIKYKKYKNEFKVETNTFKNLNRYLLSLKADSSHVTYKLNQAINFIKYTHLTKFTNKIFTPDNTFEISIDKLSNEISKILTKNGDKELRTVDLIPPSFLKPEIILTNQVKLSSLSSGEKQRIYAVSTIGYHLLNIDSANNDQDMITYKFVNIIFDEIELYYHPEMQRTFVSYLLKYISYLPIELAGLNITFVTHSPFILSDIPAHNIVFLGEEKNEWDTFGANIHDMLSDSFFLHKGVMGEFVKETILSLNDFLTNNNYSGKIKWDRESSWNVINIIGEPIIKKQLSKMWISRYNEEDLSMKIINMEKELKKLKDAQNSVNRNTQE
ncbi:MAG: AAA family ATPase [Sphingobacterium sp.]